MDLDLTGSQAVALVGEKSRCSVADCFLYLPDAGRRIEMEEVLADIPSLNTEVSVRSLRNVVVTLRTRGFVCPCRTQNMV